LPGCGTTTGKKQETLVRLKILWSAGLSKCLLQAGCGYCNSKDQVTAPDITPPIFTTCARKRFLEFTGILDGFRKK
jgi:hypothetical protein